MPYNNKSKENLKKFSAQYQPQRRGRKRGQVSIMREVEKVLKTKDPASGKRISELYAEAIVKQGMSGNFQYCRELILRIDGKVPEAQVVVERVIQPVTFNPQYVDEKPENSDE